MTEREKKADELKEQLKALSETEMEQVDTLVNLIGDLIEYVANNEVSDAALGFAQEIFSLSDQVLEIEPASAIELRKAAARLAPVLAIVAGKTP